MKKQFLKKALPWVMLLFIIQMPVLAAVDTKRLDDALPDDARVYVSLSPDNGDLQSGLSGIWNGFIGLLQDALRTTIAEGFFILAIAGICSVLAGISATASDIPQKMLDVTAISAVTALCISGASGVLESCRSSIEQLGGFSAVLIPVYGVAVAVSGHPASGLSTATGTLIASNILISLASGLLIPAIYLHIILAAAGHITENEVLLGLAVGFRKAAMGFFKYFLMLYSGYVSLSGLISSGSDAMTLRTAKMTLAGSVPVLGSVISDVSETLLSGAVVLKNAIGIYGFIGALAICLVPFAAAALRFLLFKLLSLFASGLSGGRLAKLLLDVSESYSMALGLLGTCCIMLFLSFVIGSVVISS